MISVVSGGSSLVAGSPFLFTVQAVDQFGNPVANYAGPAIEQAINQVVQVTKLENINEHINELRDGYIDQN